MKELVIFKLYDDNGNYKGCYMSNEEHLAIAYVQVYGGIYKRVTL